jgi:hypothetical protein
MSAEALIGLLAEEMRLRVFAAVVLGASTPDRVEAMTGIAVRDVMTALRRLIDGGLVTTVDGALIPQLGALQEAARRPRVPDGDPPHPDRVRAAILRAFVVDGRLVTMPAGRERRRIVLEHIVTVFTPGVRYPERDVNAMLRAWHSDHAALRRYLIDFELLARDGGFYWRIGGPTH